MVLPKSKTESNGFSMMQLLGGQPQGEEGENFALILKQLGLDTKSVGGITNSVDFIDLSSLQGTVSAQSLQDQDAVSKELHKDIVDLLASLDIESVNVEDDLSLINPKVLQNYTDDSVKQMMAEAKEYLKLQIGDLAKRQGIALDMETLPKTLQSLSVIAEKIGIDVSNITLETLQKKSPDINNSDKQLALLQPQQKSVEYSTQALVRFKSDANGIVSGEKVALTPETGTKQESLKTLLDIPVQSSKERSGKETKSVAPPVANSAEMNTALSATKPLSVAPQPAVTSSNMTVDISDETQESVRPMERVATTNATMTDSDALLKGHTVLNGDAPRTTQKDDVKQEPKIASLTSAEGKSEVLELKVKEAKQTVSHVASSLKEAVENYKPPFTRITMQLNPAKLGDVDVTMIQRGNNVHINISSNNSAIAVLAQHSVELKNQLANNGLGGATMQFNTSGGEQQRQSQHQHNMMEAYEKYAASEGEEHYETLTSLELIIPRYV